jgi:hypothetical protein
MVPTRISSISLALMTRLPGRGSGGYDPLPRILDRHPERQRGPGCPGGIEIGEGHTATRRHDGHAAGPLLQAPDDKGAVGSGLHILARIQSKESTRHRTAGNGVGH